MNLNTEVTIIATAAIFHAHVPKTATITPQAILLKVVMVLLSPRFKTKNKTQEIFDNALEKKCLSLG